MSWFWEEPAKTNLAFPFDLLLPRKCAFTTVMGQKSLTHFTHLTLLREKDKLCVDQEADWNALRMPCRKEGDITQSPVTVSIPALPGPFGIYHTTPHFVREQWIVDILIWRPLLVLFPLLGMPFYTAELFQGPGQRLALLGTLAPLIFYFSSSFKY